MAWRLAQSLVVLRDQINAAYPGRSKASDGTIGDAAHAATDSDHNPNAAGVVTAFDITHDPANGLDIAQLAESLASSRDARIKYLIRNRQIMVPADYGWRWINYSGADPHTNHLHVSVYGDYDNATNWKVGKEPKMVNEAYLDVLANAFFPQRQGKGATAEEKARYVGKADDRRVMDDFLQSNEHGEALQIFSSKQSTQTQQVKELQLESGLYKVTIKS